MQCENTANDLLIIKDLKVFMNNSIKTGQNYFFTQSTIADEFIPKTVAACTLRPVV